MYLTIFVSESIFFESNFLLGTFQLLQVKEYVLEKKTCFMMDFKLFRKIQIFIKFNVHFRPVKIRIIMDMEMHTEASNTRY